MQHACCPQELLEPGSGCSRAQGFRMHMKDAPARAKSACSHHGPWLAEPLPGQQLLSATLPALQLLQVV